MKDRKVAIVTGSATFETRHAMAVLATTNLLRALAGELPLALFATAPG